MVFSRASSLSLALSRMARTLLGDAARGLRRAPPAPPRTRTQNSWGVAAAAAVVATAAEVVELSLS